jgi:hypothetical protein
VSVVFNSLIRLNVIIANRGNSIWNKIHDDLINKLLIEMKRKYMDLNKKSKSLEVHNLLL